MKTTSSITPPVDRVISITLAATAREWETLYTMTPTIHGKDLIFGHIMTEYKSHRNV